MSVSSGTREKHKPSGPSPEPGAASQTLVHERMVGAEQGDPSSERHDEALGPTLTKKVLAGKKCMDVLQPQGRAPGQSHPPFPGQMWGGPRREMPHLGQALAGGGGGCWVRSG